ncbi:zinc finger protein ZPR1 [Bacillus rossius redtenbacheri]|uniref:zinc finger protein ZPR1 n=1 Tax=Bacillus rossius redtenbacheri TaxID=93214 RepID=UPI002FDE2C90
METRGSTEPLFTDIKAVEDCEPTEIESLCVNCGDNGITRILLTKIPFYKEVVIMSFSCEKCGFKNNEMQSGGKVEEKGGHIVLRVASPSDLNRQVVKSDFTSVQIPELEFEIPAQSQKGEVTTVEGIIDRSIQGLEQDQVVRRIQNPEVACQIDTFVEKLKKLKELQTPFTLVLDDASGNTFVENREAPRQDPAVQVRSFARTKEQDHALGIYSAEERGLLEPSDPGRFPLESLESEVLQFRTDCPGCGAPCETNMKLTNIPYFKEVVIMATNCDLCGNRSNEVKSGGGIEPKGLHIEVKVSGVEDFSRDVLKSETCSLGIPELSLEVGPAALGGRFTTVEGVLTAMRDQLTQGGIMFGDSADPDARQKLDRFLDQFDRALRGDMPVTLVLDDPAGNSYVQSLTPPEPDNKLSINKYERTYEDNEELGLNDMKVEGYEES